MTGIELKCLRYEVVDAVAVVTLSRPDRGNAWTGRMEYEYTRAIEAADRDPAVGAILITGAGKSFCVGADAVALNDMSEHMTYDAGVREPNPKPGNTDHAAHGARHGFLLSLNKPVIAAINGSAAGIGFAIACFCDIRFAAVDAKLTAATARLGLPAEFGVSWILPRLVGGSRAAQLLLGSAVIDGMAAEKMGLVHRTAARDRLFEEAFEHTKALVRENGPVALRLIKRQLWDAYTHDFKTCEGEATRLMTAMIAGPDFATGVRALKDRTAPNYLDRYRATSNQEGAGS